MQSELNLKVVGLVNPDGISFDQSQINFVGMTFRVQIDLEAIRAIVREEVRKALQDMALQMRIQAGIREL